ncbi:MAG: hypothetical protein RR047_01640 [Bacilli bacterium]
MWESLRSSRSFLINKKFITTLCKTTNLVMIESAKGKDTRKITRTKQWKQLLEVEIDKLISLFTYKEWLDILFFGDMTSYTKASKNKTADIKINLTKFLTNHYISIYDLLDLDIYSLYQTKSLNQVSSLILMQDVFLGDNKIDAVLINYKDDSRMCYNQVTSLRVMVENIEVKPESIVITLVDINSVKSRGVMSLLKAIFFME